jgi:acyl-CoA synthetase (AMP-forming)/AMP-acid ligase II
LVAEQIKQLSQKIEEDAAMAERPMRDLRVPTIPEFLHAAAAAHEDRNYVSAYGRTVSFREVERESARLARGLLAAGLGKDSRVGLLMANRAEWVIAFYAILRIGARVALMSTFYKGRELAHVLRHSDTDTLLLGEEYAGNNHYEAMEGAVPGLAASDGARPLRLETAPFLRSVWVLGDRVPRWARSTFADLAALGESDRGANPALLAAVESEVHASDPAIMIYTSGSTADPKAVVHQQATLVRKALALVRPYDFGPDDRICSNTPFFWVGGLLHVLVVLRTGGTILCPTSPKPADVLAAMRSGDANRLTGWQNQLLAIKNSPDFRPEDFEKLKPVSVTQTTIIGTGAKLPFERYANSLGMTETLGPHSCEITGQELPESHAGSFGRSLLNAERRIVDPTTGRPLGFREKGELQVRGWLLMLGFYKRERADSFDPDGWYSTGDECSLGEDGHLYFHGRLGEMIKTTGANVAPAEVEAAFKAWPEVVDPTVLGIPDAKLGERVVAAVVLRKGVPRDEAAWIDRLKKDLSSYKVPKRIFFYEFDDLPRSASGKILRHAVKGMLIERLKTEMRTEEGLAQSTKG